MMASNYKNAGSGYQNQKPGEFKYDNNSSWVKYDNNPSWATQITHDQNPTTKKSSPKK